MIHSKKRNTDLVHFHHLFPMFSGTTAKGQKINHKNKSVLAQPKAIENARLTAIDLLMYLYHVAFTFKHLAQLVKRFQTQKSIEVTDGSGPIVETSAKTKATFSFHFFKFRSRDIHLKFNQEDGWLVRRAESSQWLCFSAHTAQQRTVSKQEQPRCRQKSFNF